MQHLLTKSFVQIPKQIPGIACLLLMVYAYGVAPLQPTLTREFNSTLTAFAIPVFALCFALAAAAMVLFHHFMKLQQWFMLSLIWLCAGALLLSLARSAEAFLLIRAFTGLGTGMMLPSALMLAPAGKKSGALGSLIMVMFALGAGMTFGPSLGGWINALAGWRILYHIIAILTAMLILAACLNKKRGKVMVELQNPTHKATDIFRIIWKSRYIYLFVYLTGIFHSGVFVWISNYFTVQYGQNEYHIANDLMVFGLPGLAVTFMLYRYHLDTRVLKILYAGLGLTIAGLIILMTNLPLWLAECLLAAMSVGFSCSQPIFIGILRMPASVKPLATGSAVLFAGYGSGPLIIIALLDIHMGAAMAFLVVLVMALAVVSRLVWRQPAIHLKSRGHFIRAGMHQKLQKI
ncbi:MFS transporter [Mucilaginibacter sp. UR6-1]|uniref:MFS transporter n=1 Tax=Mucilaginibacter sp. UR6-1 TaxID=1435643 RepID=UPI001E37F395|nr:MFS transporter [Mucilaginibacter sp. UR6-1]MCC8408552.1 MFS transporter [Mucilaginibacter sp. UR6-1]